ncbi:Trypsin [BD1-7 clade bacterium]|uniref:Trypsin n=1 Tax=BD1-7 clade bacterium TaxID=2029982 RepID=A0A5S9Q502_9GAMM|nr:Trypsin [BD1-7 clade bacterium]CAA0112838.1 Trypsin [BD1-7 clade bacterium]
MTPYRTTAGLIFCAFAATASAEGGKQRIVGGSDVNQDEWPWMVSLQDANSEHADNGHSCGSSLIANRWVLTASHCLTKTTNPEQLEVRISGHDLSQTSASGQLHQVKRVLLHPNYNTDTLDRDIALLELASTSDATSISPINNVDMARVVHDTTLSVIGWGQRSETDRESPTVLQQVSVPFVSRDTCEQARNGGDGELSDTMICAGPPEGGKAPEADQHLMLQRASVSHPISVKQD